MNENFMSVKIAPVQRCTRCGRFVKHGLWNWITHELEECPVPPAKVKVIYPPVKTWHFPPMGPALRDALEEALESYFEEHQNRMKL